MNNLLERLQAGEVLVGDGAMGTMLFAAGLKPGDCPEAFNLSKPELLEDIARQYLDAGADLIETNTFGGSPLKLSFYDLDGKTEEINRAAVKAVRKAVGDQALISGSCGPSGKILKPYGDTDPEQMRKSFARQLRALAEAGVDLFCIETMTDIHEAVIAVTAAKEVAPDLPVMATMTFDATPRGFFTVMGVTVERAAEELAAAGADVIGSNCGNGSDNMVKIAQEFRKHTKLPILIQSNAGLPVIENGEVVYLETPEYMAERARQMIELGVSIIGGCCGTTPEHIRAVRNEVDRI
jgi:5-methyltetrahydrofolate--homocysteine methyltransferase